MKSIVIIGAGDLGKEVVWLVEDINKNKPTYVILGFLDDDVSKVGEEFYGYKVLGNDDILEDLQKKSNVGAVIAIQKGDIRKKIVERHPVFNDWVTLVHPTAVIASTSSVGIGSIVFPYVSISVDSKLGDFNLYYINCTICNDCKLGDYVSVMSNASISEHSMIGDEGFLSAGCTIYPHINLARHVSVGVGVAVCKDYGDNTNVSEKGTGFSLFK